MAHLTSRVGEATWDTRCSEPLPAAFFLQRAVPHPCLLIPPNQAFLSQACQRKGPHPRKQPQRSGCEIAHAWSTRGVTPARRRTQHIPRSFLAGLKSWLGQCYRGTRPLESYLCPTSPPMHSIYQEQKSSLCTEDRLSRSSICLWILNVAVGFGV